MVTRNTKTIRSHKAQIKYLCEYMNSHPNFAAGNNNTPQGVAQSNQQWLQVKAALDKLGPQRTVEQWKVAWRDQKRKAKVEGGSLNKAIKYEIGNSADDPGLTQNPYIILDTIGHEMAVGCGPEESPIGFTSTSTPAAPRSAPAAPKTSRLGRVRKSHPPERFLNAQLELNTLMKELIKEVRRSNTLREENNLLMRHGAQKASSCSVSPLDCQTDPLAEVAASPQNRSRCCCRCRCPCRHSPEAQ